MSYQQEVFSFISSIIGQSHIIPVHVEFTRFVGGDANTSMLLSQIIYWTDKTSDPDGWFYKSYDEWERETALTKRKVSRSVDTFKKMGLVETKVKKINNNTILHYRFNQYEFVDQFGKYLEAKRAEKTSKVPSILGSDETSFPEIPKRHFQKSHNVTSLPYIQKTTTKNYDVPPPPSDPKPVPPTSSPKKTSSSFSSPEVNQHDFTNLMQCIPQKKRSKSVEQRLTKAMIAGYAIAYLLDAIAYTNNHAKKDYLSYLGNTIDKEWAPKGYYRQSVENTQREAQRVKDRQREQEEQQREQLAMKQKHEVLDNLLKNDSEHYFELVDQAANNLGIDDVSKPGRGGKMKIKFEIMRILGL